MNGFVLLARKRHCGGGDFRFIYIYWIMLICIGYCIVYVAFGGELFVGDIYRGYLAFARFLSLGACHEL
jgi:hypothetical protein